MNVNELTSDQCRDELAKLKGWTLEPYGTGQIWCPHDWPNSFTGIRSGDDHPIPDTLDEASKLPAGWRWYRIEERHRESPMRWAGIAVHESHHELIVRCFGSTDKESRFRTRLACELENRKEATK